MEQILILTIFRRRKIGFVFQRYNLVPVLNVYENVVLPIELDGKIRHFTKKMEWFRTPRFCWKEWMKYCLKN